MRRIALALIVALLCAVPVATQELDATKIYLGTTPCVLLAGAGSPEGAVTASCGTYWDTTNRVVYNKATGTGNTGWVLVQAGSGYVTGSGVTGAIPKWAGASYLADSQISDLGTYVSVLGSIVAGGTVKAGSGAALSGGTPSTAGLMMPSGTPADTTTNLHNRSGVLYWGASPLFSAAALTKTDDTNVTLTLGGTPATALLQAASITLGWTGTLAASRLNSNVVQGITNDTNVTGSIATQTLTLGWTGTLATTRGGTGVSSWTVGDLPYYASGTALSKLGIGAANRVLTSSGSAPQWSESLTLDGSLAINQSGVRLWTMGYGASSGNFTLASGDNLGTFYLTNSSIFSLGMGTGNLFTAGFAWIGAASAALDDEKLRAWAGPVIALTKGSANSRNVGVNGVAVGPNSTGSYTLPATFEYRTAGAAGHAVDNAGYYPVGVEGLATGSAGTHAYGGVFSARSTSSGNAYGVYVPNSVASTGGTAYAFYSESSATNYLAGPLTLGNALNFGSTITLSPVDSNRLGIASGDSLESGFTSGWSGSGYTLNYNQSFASQSYLEVDRLNVRGILSVYELLAHQIRATNGSIFVANTGKASAVTDNGGGSYTITTDVAHGFAANDLIRAQRFTGTGTYQSDLTVASVADTTHFTATLRATYTPPASGMEFVRLGSTSDADRQGSIYLTADDTNAPYINILSGVAAFTDWGTAAKTKVRVGNLNGICGYSTNVFGLCAGVSEGASITVDGTNGVRVQTAAASGARVSLDTTGLKGYDAGPTLRFSVLTDGSGTLGTNGITWSTAGVVTMAGFTVNATELYAGTGATRVQMTAAGGFHAGATAFADAPASISNAGVAKFTSATITGSTINGVASSAIAGWAHASNNTYIDGADIYTGTVTATQIAANTITANKLYAYPGGQMINADPMLRDVTAWIAEVGSISFQTVSDAPVGTTVIRSGSPPTFLKDARYYPVDPTKTYRVRFWVRSASGTDGTLYADLHQYRDDQGTTCTGNGGRQPYKPAHVTPTTAWVEHSNVWGPSDFQNAAACGGAGVKFVRLDWLLNYGGSAGYMEIAWVRFEEMVTAELIVDGTITGTDIYGSTLSAIKATMGTVEIGSGGYVRQGQTAYLTGTGFWLGDASGTPKFSIGDAGNAYLAWTGTALQTQQLYFDGSASVAAALFSGGNNWMGSPYTGGGSYLVSLGVGAITSNVSVDIGYHIGVGANIVAPHAATTWYLGQSGAYWSRAYIAQAYLGANTWHQSSDGKQRLYFAENSTTYLKGGATSGDVLVFRDSADTALVTITGSSVNVGGLNVGWDQSGVRSWTMGTGASSGNLTLASGDGSGQFRVNVTTTNLLGNLYVSSFADVGGAIYMPANTWLYGSGSYAMVRNSYLGYSSSYRTVQIGSGSSSVSLGVDLTGNSSGSFGGTGSEVFFQNGVSLKTPNASNDGYYTIMVFGTDGIVNATYGYKTNGTAGVSKTCAVNAFTVNGGLVTACTAADPEPAADAVGELRAEVARLRELVAGMLSKQGGQ